MNGGSGYFGVNYMHSFEILRTLGTPTVNDYGGMSIDGGERWISGYDLYYSAMKNRISGVKQIKVNTPDGLLTLKHWLVNHLEGAEIGGIANFNAGSPWNYQSLPSGSPEEGKKVMVQFAGTYATHAMTIVGYNDSIRYDYNEDGQFTNHLDINNDGSVDMRDWEIGGVKFANTYGNTWADSGFCYLMYKVLADDVTIGGIWNSTVNILDVKETYEPLLTMKLVIKHDSREKIRIAAGVTTDTAKLKPDHYLYFPVFNYQGGHKYMQGGRESEEYKTIEFGLDITPLLSYLEPGQFGKFFVEVIENDPKNEGSGEIIYYAIIDYTSGINLVACPQLNVPITDNKTTRLSVIHNPTFDKVAITTDELPVILPGQNYQHQMTATGGAPDYRWELKTPYYQQMFTGEFPAIDEQQLALEAPHYRYVSQELEFEFPFYGETFSKVYLHRDGYIMFDEDIYPWPYYNDGYLLFRQMKSIAAFSFYPVEYYSGTKRDEGFWYEGDETYAAFRWKKSLTHHDHTVGYGEFAVTLYPDGSIEYFFNNIELDEDILWYSGVSAGLNIDHTIIENANSSKLPRFTAYRLIPELIPQEFSLSENGLLSGNAQPGEDICNLSFKIKDEKEISALKTLQLSDGLIFDYTITAGEDPVIQSGELVKVNLTLKNISSQQFFNVQAAIVSKDPNLEIHTATALFGDIQPGQQTSVEQAFEMTVSNQCPDQYGFLVDLQIQSDQIDRSGKMSFVTQAPILYMQDYMVIDGDNQRLDPGETADVQITLINEGNAAANGVTGFMYSKDPYITINNSTPLTYGNLLSGATGQNSYSVTVDAACPIAHEAKFYFIIETANGTQVLESFDMSIGQYPLMVINFAKNENSVSVIKSTLDELGMAYIYSDTLPAKPEIYKAIMLCLGTFYSNTALTTAEGLLLSDYLEKGGRLYMEGTTTWYIDPQTAVHPKFNNSVITVANWISFNHLFGVEGSFAEGLSFDFTGAYNLLPCYFQPVNTAFPVLRADNGDGIYTMSAFENDTYRTIGSILEFGSLGNANAVSERKALMTGILEFFDLEDYFVAIMEHEKAEEKRIHVTVSPNPFTDFIHFYITHDATERIELAVFELNGQLIHHDFSTYGTTSDSQPISIHLPLTLSPGVYFYRVISGNHVATGKLIKLEK